MECKFKTTYEMYEDDFDKAVGQNVQKFCEAETVYLTLTCNENFSISYIIEIMEFVKFSFNIEKDENLKEEIFNDENLKDDEIEIILKV